jgi:hypothetical protein
MKNILNKLKRIPLYLGLLALPFLGNKVEAQAPNIENPAVGMINPFWYPYYYQDPSEWNHADSVWNLADKNTKIEMLEQAFTQDSIHDEAPLEWNDGQHTIHYADQTMINYNGYNELVDGSLNLTNFGFSLEHNGEFKIPVFLATIVETNKTYNAVMVGDNILELNDWYVFDSNTAPGTPNRRLTPGNGLPSASNDFFWYTTIFWENFMMGTDTLVRNIGPPNTLSFAYNNDTTFVNIYNTGYTVLKNPKNDSIPPEITCSIQDEDIVNISDLDISVSDSSFLNEFQFYQIDSQELDTFPGTYLNPNGSYRLPLYKKDITIPVSLNDGAHTLKIYGLDLPKNLDSLVINFTQDATPPGLVVNSPKDSTYHINKIPLDFIASDDNLDPASSYFQLNSENKIYLNQQIPDSIIAEQGANNLKFYIKDLAGNAKLKTRNFYSDTTSSIAENKTSEFKLYPNPTNSNFTVEYFLQSPENVSFKMYNSQGQELEDKLIKSNVGKNKFDVSLEDYSKGIYFYNIITEQGYSETGYVVKQ